MFAIISAVNHFEVYLLGIAFRVITDHRALIYLEMKETNNRCNLSPFPLHIDLDPRMEMKIACLVRAGKTTILQGGGSVRILPTASLENL